jgi:hypothetical protein
MELSKNLDKSHAPPPRPQPAAVSSHTALLGGARGAPGDGAAALRRARRGGARGVVVPLNQLSSKDGPTLNPKADALSCLPIPVADYDPHPQPQPKPTR